MSKLTGKVALITMDEYGLAAAVAVKFGQEKAIVVIADKNKERLETTAHAVRLTGAECFPVMMNPTDVKSCESGVNTLKEQYGRLDVLCNLAGEFPRTGTFHEVEEAEFDRLVAASIKSVLLVSRFAVPLIRESEGQGSVINLVHTAALSGIPGTSLLAATKGGLLNMTQNMALQGSRDGYRVNCVCVGDSFLPLTPSQLKAGILQETIAQELAPTFVYLATEESCHMCGHVLTIDDGMQAWVEGKGIPMSEISSINQTIPDHQELESQKGYMEGDVALITAGGGGIGRACALLFAQEGAKVVLSDINQEAAVAVAAEVRSAGGEAIAISADVLNSQDCQQVVQETIAQFGKLNVLVNLVGFFGKGGGGVDTVSLEEWDWMMDINLKSVFMMSKYSIPEIIRSGGGAIINTGTLAAVVGRGGSPCYGTGKSGVLALTRSLAADYFGQHIRVNAVCPSATDTPMLSHAISKRAATEAEKQKAKDEFQQSHMGLSTPEEIAYSYLYLASKQLSPKITGHILLADNGFSMMRF